jgi:L-ascorbate metabolism protein UlaG (beta-lactamase superfamily)
MMNIQYIRHATLILNIAGRKILVDPMLSEVSELPPVPLTTNRLKNPLIPLPHGSLDLMRDIDAVLLTHYHFDHFDKAAEKFIPKDVLIFCQPGDDKKLKKMGYTNARVIDGTLEWGPLNLKRFPANHARGYLLKVILGKTSSYYLQSGADAIFLTGDALFDNLLLKSLGETKPAFIIANAGSAKFFWDKPVTLAADDMKEMLMMLPGSRIAAVHMDAINHCMLTKDALRKYAAVENISGKMLIPAEGEFFEKV